MSSRSEPTTQRLVILTEGHTNPLSAKTATCVLRYGRSPTVALLDSQQLGKTAQQLLGVGGDVPIVGRLEDARGANTLMIGIAPTGGRIPGNWRSTILQAINSGMTVISGLHEFLCDDKEFSAAATHVGATLIDVRKNSERDVAQRKNIREACLRIHTVGQDCSVGKMLVAVELTRALQAQGHNAKFVATGQTGIMIEGDGCPVDCVVADFINGAVEKQILAQQHHEILLVEGQGSLTHPRYSSVTLGLLHGCIPHGMILCYEVGRPSVHGMPHIPLKSLAELRSIYEHSANIMFPSQVIGIAMNSRLQTAEAADQERDKVRREFGLPVCDVIRHGPGELVEAVLQLQRILIGAST
jgi:uncharacterized NAD-dependent epimerase/dehydratase family protein